MNCGSQSNGISAIYRVRRWFFDCCRDCSPTSSAGALVRAPALSSFNLVTAAEDKAGRLEARTVFLPPEVVTVAEQGARPEAALAVAAEPDAQPEAAVVQPGERRMVPWVEMAQTAVVRLWNRAAVLSAAVLASQVVPVATEQTAVDPSSRRESFLPRAPE